MAAYRNIGECLQALGFCEENTKPSNFMGTAIHRNITHFLNCNIKHRRAETADQVSARASEWVEQNGSHFWSKKARTELFPHAPSFPEDRDLIQSLILDILHFKIKAKKAYLEQKGWAQIPDDLDRCAQCKERDEMCDAVKPPCGPCKSQRLKCIYINEALSDSMERSVTAKTQEESGQSRLVAATAGSDHSGLRSPKAASTANLDECSPSFPQSNAVTDNVIEAEDTNMPDVGKACFYALWSSTSTDRAVKSKSGNTTSLEHGLRVTPHGSTGLTSRFDGRRYRTTSGERSRKRKSTTSSGDDERIEKLRVPKVRCTTSSEGHDQRSATAGSSRCATSGDLDVSRGSATAANKSLEEQSITKSTDTGENKSNIRISREGSTSVSRASEKQNTISSSESSAVQHHQDLLIVDEPSTNSSEIFGRGRHGTSDSTSKYPVGGGAQDVVTARLDENPEKEIPMVSVEMDEHPIMRAERPSLQSAATTTNSLPRISFPNACVDRTRFYVARSKTAFAVMYLDEADTFEKFHSTAIAKAGLDTSSRKNLSALVLVKGELEPMRVNNEYQHWMMLLSVKHWPGWDLHDDHSRCTVFVNLE